MALSPTFAVRRALAARRASGPLKAFYAVPAPEAATPASELGLLAIDAETTGLEPATDAVLSLGHVPVDGETIVLAGAVHHVLDAGVAVGQSAVFHGITDDELATGDDLEAVMTELLEALAGRALLAHFAYIERSFLSRLCERLYGAPLIVPAVCTLVLHDRLINRGFDDEAKANELRLWNARARYGLPVYRAHDALVDALACAELYLAQVTELGDQRPQTLRTLATR